MIMMFAYVQIHCWSNVKHQNKNDELDKNQEQCADDINRVSRTVLHLVVNVEWLQYLFIKYFRRKTMLESMMKMFEQKKREAWCVLKQENERQFMLKLTQVFMISENDGVNNRTTVDSNLHDLERLRRKQSSQRRFLLTADRWFWHRVIFLIMLLD